MVHGYSIREKQFILLKYCITEVAPIFRNHGSKRLDWWLNLSRNTHVLAFVSVNAQMIIINIVAENNNTTQRRKNE
jgi:hypothetical protein